MICWSTKMVLPSPALVKQVLEFCFDRGFIGRTCNSATRTIGIEREGYDGGGEGGKIQEHRRRREASRDQM